MTARGKHTAKASADRKRRANIAAAVASACVMAFALLFVGALVLLDQLAPGNQPEEIPVEQQVPNGAFYVLLIGSDTRKGTALYTGKATDHAQVDQHADVMTLMRVDPRNLKITFLSIPRDTAVSDDEPKINNALLGNDPNEVVEAVHDLTGIRADFYMMTTFATFADLVDALGGIDVDVPADVTVDDPATGSKISLHAGPDQHLNGARALALARARHEYGENQDVFRQANVRAIEAAIVRRVLAYPDVADVERLLAVVEGDVTTNMDMKFAGLEIMKFLGKSDEVAILGGTGPYEGGGERASDGQWVIPADRATWEDVVRAFKRGRDPSSVVAVPELSLLVEGKSGEGDSSDASSKSAVSTGSKEAKGSKSAAGQKKDG